MGWSMKHLNGYFMKSSENVKQPLLVENVMYCCHQSTMVQKHGTEGPWNRCQGVNHCLGTEQRTAGANSEDGNSVFSAQTQLHCRECDTVVGLACSHIMTTAKVFPSSTFFLVAFIWVESSACSPMGRFQLRWVFWAWKWFHFCAIGSVPMQQQLRSSLLSQGLPAIPCALLAPCATRAALVEHRDAQSPGLLDLHGDCPVCGAQPSPCPACTVGQPKLLSSKQPHVCAGAAWLRAAFCQGSLAPPLQGGAPAAVSVAVSEQLGALLEPRQLGRRALGSHRALPALGQGPPASRWGREPPEPPSPWPHWSPTVSKLWQRLLPLPVPCGNGLGHLQEEQSFPVSLRSPES